MIEFLAFSDTHFHEFRTYEEIVDHPIAYYDISMNSRLRDTWLSCYDIFSYAKDHGISTILFGGDLFHTKASYTKAAMEAVYDLLHASNDFGVHIHMITGNHDQATKNGHTHGLTPFEALPNVSLLSGYNGFTPVNDIKHQRSFDLWWNSYIPDRLTLTNSIKSQANYLSQGEHKKRPSVLLCHAGVQGGKVGSDYVLLGEEDLDLGDIPYADFDVCLFGHFHQHQNIAPNAWFIGSTHQHNWGCANGLRGFVHVTIDEDRKVTLKHIENTGAPKFINLVDNDELDKVKLTDFVRYYTRNEVTPNLIERVHGVFDAKLGGIPKVLEILPLPEETEEKKEKLHTDALSSEKLVDKWVDHMDPEEAEELKKLGKELLREAKGESL